MGIDTNFIQHGTSTSAVTLIFCWSSMQMPSSGKNTKTVINRKSLIQFLQNWCQFSYKFLGANICEKDQKTKLCGTKFQKYGLNYDEMTRTNSPHYHCSGLKMELHVNKWSLVDGAHKSQVTTSKLS